MMKLPHLSPFWRSAIERIVWTAIQAALGVIVVVLAHVTAPWAILVAAAAAMLKTIAAKHIGNKSEPSIP